MQSPYSNCCYVALASICQHFLMDIYFFNRCPDCKHIHVVSHCFQLCFKYINWTTRFKIKCAVLVLANHIFQLLTLPTDKSGGFSVRPPQPASARSYTVSPSVWVRACPALPYVSAMPRGAALHSGCSLRRWCPDYGQRHRRGKSTPGQTNPLYHATEHHKRNTTGMMERSGLS